LENLLLRSALATNPSPLIPSSLVLTREIRNTTVQITRDASKLYRAIVIVGDLVDCFEQPGATSARLDVAASSKCLNRPVNTIEAPPLVEPPLALIVARFKLGCIHRTTAPRRAVAAILMRSSSAPLL
jgi:hypothetical protein